MPDTRLCCVAWCQDIVTCSDVRTSGSSFLSTMEESWGLTSAATEALECSEDMAFDDMDDLNEALPNAGIPLKHQPHLSPDSPQPSKEIDFREHIRVDLQTQEDFCNLRFFDFSRLPSSTSYASALGTINDAAPSPASRKQPTRVYASPFLSPPASFQTVAQPQRNLSSSNPPPKRFSIQAPDTCGLPPTSQLGTDRQLLVRWMLQLSAAAGLQRETLFGAASLLDRFLDASYRNQQDVQPSEGVLQLLAMACVSLAMKMEEVNHLHTSDLLGLAAHPDTMRPLYQASDLGRMEWVLLQTVGWRAHAPTPHTFMQHLLTVLASVDATTAAQDALATQWTEPMPVAADGDGVAQRFAEPAAAPLSAASQVFWVEHLAHWASAFLDLALVCVTPLAHRPSTLAMACLLMATSYTTGMYATADATPNSATGVGPTTAALAMVLSAMTKETLAPEAGRAPTSSSDAVSSVSISNGMVDIATSTTASTDDSVADPAPDVQTSDSDTVSTTPAASPFLSGSVVAAAVSAERFRLLLHTLVDVTGLSIEQLAPGLTACVGELEVIMMQQQQAGAAAQAVEM